MLPVGMLRAVRHVCARSQRRLRERGLSTARGFGVAEFQGRLSRAQDAMAALEVDALWVSSEADVRYFTGVDSEFWQSPTRPVFVVVPREGRPIGVVPEIWAPAMAATEIVGDVRTWPSPREADDGVSLVVEALLEGCPRRFGAVGLPMGLESAARAPVSTVDAVRSSLAAAGVGTVDASPVVRSLRQVKSAAEVAKLAAVAEVGSAAFAALPGRLRRARERRGVVSERDAAREMRLALLEAGADQVPYVACTSGRPSYASVVAAPTDAALRSGAVLVVDAGARLDGYFCDFNRNFYCGAQPGAEVAAAQEALWAGTEAAIDACRPGATLGDVYDALASTHPRPPPPGGRFGHFLGVELTELPSIAEGAPEVLEAGHVLCLEPGIAVEGGGGAAIVVHEETVAVAADGPPAVLSARAPRAMEALAFFDEAATATALRAAEAWPVRSTRNPRLRAADAGAFFRGAALAAQVEAQAQARRAVAAWDGYEPSRIVDLPDLAAALGVKRVVAKDESNRFGTGSFKALGGALVVSTLAEASAEPLTVATASAGNHGLGVAWGARRAGADAVVYLGDQVSEAMADRMRALGATVARAGDSYEKSVAKCKRDAEDRGYVVIQDVGVKGDYEDIPRTIHAGYGIVAAETLDQLAADPPTHVLVNAGVGGFAAGMANTILAKTGADHPKLVAVEPSEADCLRRLATGDGSHTTRGPTVQTGLDCHEVCPLAWDTLETTVATFIAVPDDAVEPAKALLDAHGLVAGESAVASLAALLKAATDPRLKADLDLDASSVVVFVVCEGPPGGA